MLPSPSPTPSRLTTKTTLTPTWRKRPGSPSDHLLLGPCTKASRVRAAIVPAGRLLDLPREACLLGSLSLIIDHIVDLVHIWTVAKVLPSDPAPRPIDDAAAKRAFFRIIEAWGVSDAEARVLLGAPSRSTFYNYKRAEGGPLSADTIERLSYVLGIYKALQLLFPNPQQADAWMRKPNQNFGGRSALQHALGGKVVDLALVRRTLDAARGEGM